MGTIILFQIALLRYHVHNRLPVRLIATAHPALSRVRDYIHAHFARPLTLPELADVACLSEYHLCRLFSKRFGMGPHQYLNQVRVDGAKRLLLTGQAVGEVARQVGFYDNSHLVLHFRHIVGMAPSRYR